LNTNAERAKKYFFLKMSKPNWELGEEKGAFFNPSPTLTRTLICKHKRSVADILFKAIIEESRERSQWFREQVVDIWKETDGWITRVVESWSEKVAVGGEKPKNRASEKRVLDVYFMTTMNDTTFESRVAIYGFIVDPKFAEKKGVTQELIDREWPFLLDLLGRVCMDEEEPKPSSSSSSSTTETKSDAMITFANFFDATAWNLGGN